MNALRINQSLAAISKHVDTLGRGTLFGNVDLLGIARVVGDMQADLTSDQIVGGYRADAIDQMFRVLDLIEEAGKTPDHKALLSIGMAMELAVERLHNYRQMVNYALRARGAAHGLDQLAA